MRIRYAAAEERGARSRQEDASLVIATLGLAAVADGMGASFSGRPAADLAVETLAARHATSATFDDVTEARARIVDAIVVANAKIHARRVGARDRRHVGDAGVRWRGMATTVGAARVVGDSANVVHVGVSRAYRWSGDGLTALTRDHSLVNEAIDEGITGDALADVPKGIVVRALGFCPCVRLDVSVHRLAPGDVLLLASDGLTSNLSDDEIGATLRAHVGDISGAAKALVASASTHGAESKDARGGDNITAVVALVEE